MDATHAIDASFAPDLATNATPVWWLVQHNLGTNDDEVVQDDDGDGLWNWEEYIVGTDPTTNASSLSMEIVDSNGTVVVRYPTVQADGSGYEEVERYYDLQDAPHPGLGTWQPVAGYTNVVGDGSTVSHTNSAGNPARAYRVKAWLE